MDCINLLTEINLFGGSTMNKTITTVLIGTIPLMLTFLSADSKANGGDDFLKINNTIQNEELHIELQELHEKFSAERNRILSYYAEKIEMLKEEQLNKINTIKTDFAGRREIILNKYAVNRGDDASIKTILPPAVKNIQGKKNALRDNK